jgi:hypothetical protein
MQPTHVLTTSFTAGTYVLDATMAGADPAAAQLIVSTSEQHLKQYDSRRFSHVRDYLGHTTSITDVVAHGPMVVSSQADTGVMITDLRQAATPMFLNELRGDGHVCNSVSISPSGQHIAVAAGGAIHIVDTRTWHGVHVVQEAHCSDITRLRYVSENLVCSGGEDQMINFYDLKAKEGDMLKCAVNSGECLNRITVMPDLGLVGCLGSCETAYLFQVPEDPEADFPTELTIRRGEDFARYNVDWVGIRGQAYLITGHNSAFDDVADAAAAAAGPAPQPLTVRRWPAPADGADTSFTLAPTHRDIVRFALVVGNTDRMVTGGEDGAIAVWSTSDNASSAGPSATGGDGDDESFTSDRVGNGGGGVSDNSSGQGGRQRPDRVHGRRPLPF